MSQNVIVTTTRTSTRTFTEDATTGLPEQMDLGTGGDQSVRKGGSARQHRKRANREPGLSGDWIFAPYVDATPGGSKK